MISFKPRIVTIGIATWNRRALLQQALESALGQTCQEIEIIVSDDASTDDTWAYLESLRDPRLVCLRNAENRGLVANYNHCLRAARGEFFLMLNDDDLLEPTAIEQLRAGFLTGSHGQAAEDVGISWSPCTNISLEGEPLWTVRGGPAVETTPQLLEGLFNGTRGPLCSGVMVRTADALAAGSYEVQFGPLCDSALWGKASLRRKLAVCVSEPLWRYRVHTSSGSATSNAQCDFWQGAMRQEIADFTAILRARGDEQGAAMIERAGINTLANITITVLLRSLGKPGWVLAFAKEFWRSRAFMLTPFVGKRLVKDGWKGVRLALEASGSRSAAVRP